MGVPLPGVWFQAHPDVLPLVKEGPGEGEAQCRLRHPQALPEHPRGSPDRLCPAGGPLWVRDVRCCPPAEPPRPPTPEVGFSYCLGRISDKIWDHLLLRQDSPETLGFGQRPCKWVGAKLQVGGGTVSLHSRVPGLRAVGFLLRATRLLPSGECMPPPGELCGVSGLPAGGPPGVRGPA